jgi:repressor LexA
MNKIKDLRIEKKISQNELAKILGLTQQAISAYENGLREPDLETLNKIANYFNVSLDWLAGRTNIRNPNRDIIEKIGGFYPGPLVKIPIVGTIKAGEPILAVQNIEGYEVVELETVKDGNYFFLRVKGDSMINANIPEGALVLVRQQNDVDNGSIAVVMVDNEEATIKRVFKTNGLLVLQPENPKYKPKVIKKGDVKIIGKVVKIVITP